MPRWPVLYTYPLFAPTQVFDPMKVALTAGPEGGGGAAAAAPVGGGCVAGEGPFVIHAGVLLVPRPIGGTPTGGRPIGGGAGQPC